MCRVSKNGRGAKQTVSLSGMGLEVFAENVTAVLHLYQLLDGCLAQGTLQPWKPALHHGHASLEFSNRYFSSAKEADERVSMNIGADVDPFGILSGLNVDGVHTEDNMVGYYERVSAGTAG